MVYLSTSGFGGRRGMPGGARGPQIWCFTNCESVELFQDGKSLGVKPHAEGEVLRWPVELSGTLKAVGKKRDQAVTFELKKAGTAVRLEAHADVSALKGDGRDVMEVEVDAADKDGTLSTEAANKVHCTVTGPARIIGIENGDLNCTEPYKAESHSLYQGRFKVYVEAAKGNGQVKLEFATEGLQPASVTLPVQ
jgi:beta-galactosidase